MIDNVNVAIIGFAIVALAVAMFFPIGRILWRMGYSVWWLLLVLVPLGPVIGIWVVAFSEWPRLRKTT